MKITKFLVLTVILSLCTLEVNGNSCAVKCDSTCQELTSCQPTCTEACLDDNPPNTGEELMQCLKKCPRECSEADIILDMNTCEDKENPLDGGVALQRWKHPRYASIIRSYIPYGCNPSEKRLQRVHVPTCKVNNQSSASGSSVFSGYMLYIIIGSICVGIALLSIVAVFFYRRYKRTKRGMDILSKNVEQHNRVAKASSEISIPIVDNRLFPIGNALSKQENSTNESGSVYNSAPKTPDSRV